MQRKIQYQPKTRDFAFSLDGELLGFTRTYHEAEVALDEIVFALLAQEAPPLMAANLLALFERDEQAFLTTFSGLTPEAKRRTATEIAAVLRRTTDPTATAEALLQQWNKRPGE